LVGHVPTLVANFAKKKLSNPSLELMMMMVVVVAVAVAAAFRGDL